MNFVNTFTNVDEWPTWADVGKRIRVLFGSKAIEGELEMDSVFECEPIYEVEDANGAKHRMDDADAWEFI